MSVKQMSPDQMRADLRAIALTWPDGIPWQQQDRVNALKARLKQLGEPLEAPPGSSPANAAANPLDAMTTDELETELRALSTRNDDDSKRRFAQIRAKLRQLAEGEPAPAPRPQVVPRALEIDEDEVPFEMPPDRVASRRPAVPAPRAQARPLEKKPPASVCGYRAVSREDGSVLLEYEILSETGATLVSRVLEGDEADDFIAMVTAARTRARRMASGE